jgi:PAS domain S-box-containing protein
MNPASGMRTQSGPSEQAWADAAADHVRFSGRGEACAFPQTVRSARYPAALLFGLGGGVALLFRIGAAGGDYIGAAIIMGALLIAAAAARHALRAQAEVDALRQRLLDEQSYHAFVDAAVEGFFRTTRDGRYLIVNPALARIYGYDTPEQLTAELTDIGQSLYVDPARRAGFEETMAAHGMVRDFISRIRRRDGTLIWIAENARMVKDEDDQFLFYEGTVEDITARRDSEDATRRALAETQEAARAKAAFLAAMSHELKTPLNAVIGFSDLMRQELFGPVGEERYRSYIVDIHENGKRLLAMINDILDLSRIESRLIDLDEDIVFLPDLLRDAVAHMEGEHKNRASITMHFADDLARLRGDSRRLRQIAMHLLSNAVKFTPPTGRIHVEARNAADGGIHFAVRDTGIGMEPDRIAHALEPFKQLDSRLARRFEGVGLGLPLASALVGLHGARLAIASTAGKGTCVAIHFPPERRVGNAEAQGVDSLLLGRE